MIGRWKPMATGSFPATGRTRSPDHAVGGSARRSSHRSPGGYAHRTLIHADTSDIRNRRVSVIVKYTSQ
jgi:hypothetical protein